MLCRDCRFWVLIGKGPFGNCHRYPPVAMRLAPRLRVVAGGYDEDGSFYTKTDEQDWCGEFRRRDEEADDAAR